MQKHIFFYAQAQINVFAGSCISDAEGEDMPHRERFLAAFGGPGVSVPTDRGKRGQDTIWFLAVAHYPLFRAVRGLNERIPLLTPPHLPLDATPFGRASKCEGPTGASGALRVNA